MHSPVRRGVELWAGDLLWDAANAIHLRSAPLRGKLPALVVGEAEQEQRFVELNPAMPNACHEKDIAPAIRAWLDGPAADMAEAEYCRLIVCLWDFCEVCARSFAADFRGSEVEDLASDYLALIKLEKRHCRVAYKTGILRANKTRKAGNEGGQMVLRRFWGVI